VFKMLKIRHKMKRPQELNLPNPDELEWVDFKMIHWHSGVLGALHSKMMLIDGKTLIMGSKNLDGDTSMEYMYVLEGAVVSSMRADFQDIWGDPIPALPILVTDYKDGDFPVVVVSRSAGADITADEIHSPQNQAWLKSMDVATKAVYIQTPNFCERAIAHKVLETVKRGIEVTIVTSIRQQDFNEAVGRTSMGSNSGTMEDLFADLKNHPKTLGKLKWCWYIGIRSGPSPNPTQAEWSHVKSMVVDDEFAIIGSGNQDPQTWFHSRENNLLMDNPDVAKRIKKELLRPQQSLKWCYTGKPGEKRLK